jgi:hypothetical protein
MHGGALVALSEISDELARLKVLEQASQVPVWRERGGPCADADMHTHAH